MSRHQYRAASDPVVKIAMCDQCRATVAGFTERGIVLWLDITPVTLEVEQVYQRLGRATYRVRPRSGRVAWVDWRNPVTSQSPPDTGFVLARHPHLKPGATKKMPDPPWLISDYLIHDAPDQDPLF